MSTMIMERLLVTQRSPLPSPEVEERLRDLVDLTEELAEGLDELKRDPGWVTWNSGGAKQGKPQFRGPGYYTAREFAASAHHLHGRLVRVLESFEYRRAKDEERAQRRAERDRLREEEGRS